MKAFKINMSVGAKNRKQAVAYFTYLFKEHGVELFMNRDE